MLMEEALWLAVTTAVEVYLRTMQWLFRWHHLLLRVAALMGNMYLEPCISTEIAELQRTTKEPRSYGIWLQNRAISLLRTGFPFCAQSNFCFPGLSHNAVVADAGTTKDGAFSKTFRRSVVVLGPQVMNVSPYSSTQALEWNAVAVAAGLPGAEHFTQSLNARSRTPSPPPRS
jgi:hypothetical protein